MTDDTQEKINKLEREINELKSLFYKDNYSNLQVFRKKTELKGDATISKANITDLNDLTTTGGTAVIADGQHDVVIGVGGGTIHITTKNGVITAIT